MLRSEHQVPDYPEWMICPISFQPMSDPVTTVNGKIYDRASIETWFKTHDTDPLTNLTLASKALTPDSELKDKIRDWCDQNGVAIAEPEVRQTSFATTTSSEAAPVSRPPVPSMYAPHSATSNAAQSVPNSVSTLTSQCDALYNVCVVGDLHSRKSALIRQYIESSAEDVSSWITTLGIDFQVKRLTIDDRSIKLRLWDTAGQERFRTMHLHRYNMSHAIVIACDLTQNDAIESVTRTYNTIKTSRSSLEGLAIELVAILPDDQDSLDPKSELRLNTLTEKLAFSGVHTVNLQDKAALADTFTSIATKLEHTREAAEEAVTKAQAARSFAR